MRRSGRQRCPPVEFWNFERPDYSVSHEVSYNLSLLGGLSRGGRNSIQKKTKDINNAQQIIPRGFSIVVNDFAKTKSAVKKTNHSLTPPKPRKNTKQVKASTNALNINSRSFTRTHTNEKPEKNKTIKNNSKNQSNNSNRRNKAVRNGPSRDENKNDVLESPKVHPGKFGLQEKQVPSGRGRKAQKCFSRMSEASDSGITDLDISCGNTLINEATTNARVAEISNINMVCQDFQDATEGPDDILSNLSKNNSYCRNRKPPNFKGVLSSTAVSEVDISKFNSSNSCSDGRGVIFKVPRYVPKIFMKKNLTVEPALDSIAEEKENEIESQSDATTYLTPKKTSTLIRSRNLNLEDLQEDGDDMQTKAQSSRKQNKEKEAEKENHKDFSRNSQMPIDTTSQNLTTQSDFGSFRRSSRVRTKCLEFWNFEKAHVTTLNSGEVSVVYTKQEDPSKTIRISKRGDNPNLNPVTLPPDTNNKNDTLIENKRKSEVPQKSLTKEGSKKTSTSARKRKSASSDTDESSCSTEVSPRKRGKSHSTDVSPRKRGKNHSTDVSSRKRGKNQSFIVNNFLPTVEKVEFKSLMFYPWREDDFVCYMARSYCNKERNIYAGFLFLERGEMIWSTTKYTTFSVIEGEGALSVLDSDDDGTLVLLSANVKTVVPRGKKVRLEKEDSDELLKLLIVLQDKPY
ncbi:micronuclear linker histone polyprotein-like isoform X1 [Macrobrachium rosenbergii]|uniref:micronuclear linker histone polyprotein-like isoform X1 n=1 Tax=Macrobrachium rosenbergii TaxID=79674 RepID=UPI0034D41259